MALVWSDAYTASRRIGNTTQSPETPKRKKRRPGRPSSYRPEYCDLIIEAGKEGWSLTATAAKIGVHRATLFDWGTAHPEFGDALKLHKAHRAHWWEERLREVAMGGGAPGQVTACIFGLKNAVPEEWRDVQHQHLEHTGKESGPVKYELSPEARAMLEETMAQIHGTTPAPQPGANGAATNGAAKH
jgi:hypothetical protein